jgi:hypothetical protein
LEKGEYVVKVYVAGAYSADNVLDIFENMRKGIKVSTRLLLDGFAPFCPWLDYQYSLMLKDGEKISIETYYNYCIEWLKVSDIIFLVAGWGSSKGTKKEIEIAKELNIPIFTDYEKLLKNY